MKIKLLFISFLLTSVSITSQSQTLDAYLLDFDGPKTNIRLGPKGSVIHTISTKSIVSFVLTTPKRGWWRIDGDTYYSYDYDKEIDLGEYPAGAWIHYSCIAVETRNYGGERLYLRSKPSNKGKVEFSFTDEIQVRPIAIQGDWVQVTTLSGNHTGWIEIQWLCGNPVTNCC